MTRKLFRQEAIDAQREKYWGEVISARPLPFWVLTLAAAGIAALLIAFGVFGEYTRRERVEGYLAFDAGAAQVLTPDAGVVAQLHVAEGAEVAAGAPIATLTFDRTTRGAVSAGEAVSQELGQRRLILEKERDQWRELGDKQREQARKRVADFERELMQLIEETKLQERRVASARETSQRYKQLAKERFVADVLSEQKADEATDQEIRLQSLKRQRAQIERDLQTARLEEPAVALRANAQIEQVNRQLSELKQSVTQAEVEREAILRAPIEGTITNVAASVGQSLAADAPVVTVLPKGRGLRAELLVPTRAIGFLKKGQGVALRYEAFPVERFGQYHGQVTEVGRTVWSAGERVGPLTAKEPVYRIHVALDAQSIPTAVGEVTLRPGMLVNADVLLEKRTIVEWLFEPLLQLKGRVT